MLWYLADPASDLRSGRMAAFAIHSDVRRRTQAARTAPGRTPCSPDHARRGTRCRRCRGASPGSANPRARWRALADWLPPAELLDRIIEESAYAAELRGPRLAQARENLKKIRAIIRRIQNRGYGTLERIVTHLDHLAVGDEANAVIDATDAVSLMTIHAVEGPRVSRRLRRQHVARHWQLAGRDSDRRRDTRRCFRFGW